MGTRIKALTSDRVASLTAITPEAAAVPRRIIQRM